MNGAFITIVAPSVKHLTSIPKTFGLKNFVFLIFIFYKKRCLGMIILQLKEMIFLFFV